ncbi:hypothetical protein PO909_009306 [Leuciscus waleckii]
MTSATPRLVFSGFCSEFTPQVLSSSASFALSLLHKRLPVTDLDRPPCSHILSPLLLLRGLFSSLARLTGDDYSVQVNLSDYLDILCPHYPADHQLSGPVESLALYLVADHQFKGCVETKEAIKRWECNQPYAPYGPVRFSEKIQRFTPFSLGFEFLPGHHYYYSCK